MEDHESRNTETAKKVEKVETRTVAVSSEVKETVVNELKEQDNRKTNIVTLIGIRQLDQLGRNQLRSFAINITKRKPCR